MSNSASEMSNSANNGGGGTPIAHVQKGSSTAVAQMCWRNPTKST